MPKTSAYSYINVAATLDRRDIKALWDGDDAIVVTQGADAGTGLIGADGSGIFSISADRSATISIAAARAASWASRKRFTRPRRTSARALPTSLRPLLPSGCSAIA